MVAEVAENTIQRVLVAVAGLLFNVPPVPRHEHTEVDPDGGNLQWKMEQRAGVPAVNQLDRSCEADEHDQVACECEAQGHTILLQVDTGAAWTVWGQSAVDWVEPRTFIVYNKIVTMWDTGKV